MNKRVLKLSIELINMKVIGFNTALNNIKRILSAGCMEISITFSLNKLMAITVNNSFKYSKYNLLVIIHLPFWVNVFKLIKLIKLIKINNIKGLLILRGDSRIDIDLSIYSIIYRLSKTIKIINAIYIYRHLRSDNYYIELDNFINKLNYGAIKLITQVINKTIDCNRYLYYNDKLNRLTVFGLMLIKYFKHIEYIFLNTINIIEDRLLKLIVNDYLTIVNYYNYKLIVMINYIVKRNNYCIHLYSLNYLEGIKYLLWID